MKPIDSFSGEYRFLSNFWPSPITYKKQEWPTVEHAFQAAKAVEPISAEAIRISRSPGIAKRLGRTLFQMRPDWNEVRVGIMSELCVLKFKQNPDLMEQLKATGDAELIEGNTWGDTFWGVCKGEGKNFLGKILMEIRDDRR